MSQLSFQRTSVFNFIGCNHHPQWFWRPRKQNLSLFSLSSFYLPWIDGTRCHDLSFLNVEPASSLSSFPLRGSLVPLWFLPLEWYQLHVWNCCYFSWNLNSSLRFIQPSILHDALCIAVKLAGWQYTALLYSCPNFEPDSCLCLVVTVASWPAYRFYRTQARWPGTPISLRIFHSWLWSTQSKTLVKQNYMVFWNFFAFSMIQWMLAIWSLVPLPFLNPAFTSGNSRFMYCWSLGFWA